MRIILRYHSHGDSTKPHFHTTGNNTKHTILCSQGPHKAHNSVLVDCHFGSVLLETVQSTQFHTGGDNTKHTIPRSWKPHEAHNSMHADHITIPRLWR